jgi:hypothetical protein
MVMAQRIQYRKPSDQAFSDLLRAFPQIGAVESSSQTTMTVRGKVRWLSDSATVRVSILEVESGKCMLEITATDDHDDPDEPSAAWAIDMLIKALDDPNYKPKPPSGCAGVVLLLFGVISGTAWYLIG